jgi:hypothetical protein
MKSFTWIKHFRQGQHDAKGNIFISGNWKQKSKTEFPDVLSVILQSTEHSTVELPPMTNSFAILNMSAHWLINYWYGVDKHDDMKFFLPRTRLE